MQIFGVEIKRKQEQGLQYVVTPSSIDTGATVVNTGVNAGGYYGMVSLDDISNYQIVLVQVRSCFC